MAGTRQAAWPWGRCVPTARWLKPGTHPRWPPEHSVLGAPSWRAGMSCAYSSGDASMGWCGVGVARGTEQAWNALPRPGPNLAQAPKAACPRPPAALAEAAPPRCVSPSSWTWVYESTEGFLGTFPKLWGLRDQHNFQRKLGELIGRCQFLILLAEDVNENKQNKSAH